MVHKDTEVDLWGQHPEFPPGAESASLTPSSGRVLYQFITSCQPGVSSLEDLHGRVSAVPVDVVLGAVSIGRNSTTPATGFKVVVHVVVARVGVSSPEQEIARREALAGRNPLRNDRAESAQNHKDKLRLRLGIASYRRTWQLDIGYGARARDNCDGSIASSVPRYVGVRDLENRVVRC